ncbi:MAG: 3-hydroxybenzoate 6-monooxygenase [Hyphomicrobiaceae bacterium]
MPSDQPILIAGGGIGGLAAALGLARAGLPVIVFEKASEFAEIGAGIQIAPNAFNCFDALGVGDAVRAIAIYIDQIRMMDGVSGEEIFHVPLDEPFRKTFANPYAVVHRADLHAILLNACRQNPTIDLRAASPVTGYDQTDERVTVHVEDQSSIEGRALIGADGLHSAVRNQIIGDGPPRVSGHTTYRSVIPTEQMPEDLRWNAATLWAGPKFHVVHYPLKGWKVFNLVVTYHNDVVEAVAGAPASDEEVFRGFERGHASVRRIIEHGQGWKRWVLCDRDPNPNWIDGRVTLLGDAAHPMLQYWAQGACMALEDAVCLSRCIATSASINLALVAYHKERFARTAQVQLGARAIGDYIYHPSTGSAAARNAILGAKTSEDWFETLRWLYGYRAG